ncbi:hypothetical protein [Vibrio crassostreae]|uniref:hypothetical protein n=1 Tax=Vibrio crassostreae TaxID=246167 RepID=UPI001043D56F|nr:hypothetical protein [Vibrio crassostreae]TCO01784.1 hypothetical protein EDB51_10664 [Vibrio crassostreae]CAK2034157.1 hypothetical protein VCRA2114E5_30090 [Vibrio crassostreae]CAK2071003.1 hypothetical protein VCRA2110O4_40070 [Vibrio crassostreae]CAK2076376.1 hypothetical protein VCRA2110O1_40071 [Vibrio crassostreae]CAK2856110.1 hypothetical protein VCRA2110O3_40071 [Vibrio crassostreae]
MEVGLFWAEKGMLVLGTLFVLTSMMQYGRRSSDWKGVITMFYKRIPMNIAEYKWYRLGIALLVFAVIIRFALLILWPSYQF